jgi:hypothetical protein
LPQSETEITRILKSEIKLSPDQPFRGRLAVMIGRIFPEKREWQHYGHVHYLVYLATGNLHDGRGLWQDDVPTLMESNTLMTPVSFAFLRDLLTDPDDSQYRTIVGMRRIDPRILKTIGVRFVITDLPISGATLRAQIPSPISPKAREFFGFSYLGDLNRFDLYLYEIDGVNLGQFSPTETKLACDANQALEYLADGKTALERTVVVGEELQGPLTEAKLELFTIGRDRYHVRASSAGRSILLLPIEFSRCLKISDAADDAPRLLRADLLLTGVLFERQPMRRFPCTPGHFTIRVAASKIWQTATAWKCAMLSRIGPPSGSCVPPELRGAWIFSNRHPSGVPPDLLCPLPG